MAILLVVLSFIWWWPLGLLVLGFMVARRRGYWRHALYAGEAPMMDWEQGRDRLDRKMVRMQEKMERIRSRMDRVRTRGDWFGPASSGNNAFDEYRAETLKRLEDEQREFKDFLERLRFAKDRAEFDQFMAVRRERPYASAQPEPPLAEPHN